MMNVITAIIIVFLSGLSCWHNLRKCKEGLERELYALISIIIIIPTIIYILDAFNVPSFFKWNQNINSQDWLSFLSNYVTGIISAVIGAAVLVKVTVWQIKRNDENNTTNLRINNLPALDYKFSTEAQEKNDIQILTNIDDGNIYNFNIEVENIGLNSVKNIKVDLIVKPFMKINQRIIGENTIKLLKKDSKININSFFILPNEKAKYNIEMTVYYEDVLSNWYMQQIDVEYETYNVIKDGEYIGKTEYRIKEEKGIEEKDINKKIL